MRMLLFCYLASLSLVEPSRADVIYNTLTNTAINTIRLARVLGSKPKLKGFGAVMYGVVSKKKETAPNTQESLVAAINGKPIDQTKETMTVTEPNCGEIKVEDESIKRRFNDGDKVRFRTSGDSCEITSIELQ